jgi:hypothetical protein
MIGRSGSSAASRGRFAEPRLQIGIVTVPDAAPFALRISNLSHGALPPSVYG